MKSLFIMLFFRNNTIQVGSSERQIHVLACPAISFWFIFHLNITTDEKKESDKTKNFNNILYKAHTRDMKINMNISTLKYNFKLYTTKGAQWKTHCTSTIVYFLLDWRCFWDIFTGLLKKKIKKIRSLSLSIFFHSSHHWFNNRFILNSLNKIWLFKC